MFKDTQPPQPITRPQDSPDWQPATNSKLLGDRVERLAKPIARRLNQIGPKVERLGSWLTHVGKPASTCGCASRKACLNKISVDLKHPCRLIAEILQCRRKTAKNTKPLK